MAEEPIKPEAATDKRWFESKRAKQVAVIVGIPLLLWLMFRGTKPVVIEPRPVAGYQNQTTAAVTPKQIAEAQQQAAQEQAAVEAKKAEMEKMAHTAASGLGVKTDDIDLSTPEGQAELQNRMALARSADLAGRQAQTASTYRQYGDQGQRTGGGTSPAENRRKALLSSAVVFVRAEQSTQAPATEPPQTYPVPEPKPAEPVKKDESKPKNLLDLPPSVVAQLQAEGDYRIVPQGTVVESVLTNKLVGDAAGPSNVMLTTPLYAPGTHEVLLPPGTRILGEAASVGGFGESRLAVAYHRSIVSVGPIQYSVSLDTMPGLDQQGAVGLKGKLNQHILSTIAISGVIGAIGGLSNIGNFSSGVGSYGASQQFQAGVSQYMGQSAMQVLNRFINRKPDVTIPPGTRVKLIWACDQSLPVYTEAIRALQESKDVAQF